MNESTILLAPSPGAKPDFLATVTPLNPSKGDEDLLPFEIVLDGYSREKWAMEIPSKNDKNELGWKTVYLESVDGRGKLPGFLKYLKDRKKAAFGRFDTDADPSTEDTTKAIFVVPPDQPNPPANTSSKDVMFCRLLLDSNKLRKKSHRPAQQQQQQEQSAHLKHAASKPPPNNMSNNKKANPPTQPKKTSTSKPAKTKNGFLGNLFAAHKKTEQHLAAVPKSSVIKSSTTSSSSDGNGLTGGNTSAATIAKFRQDMEQKLLDFQRDATSNIIKISICIASITKDLSIEQKGNVTMDILKYIVYEQAEEIGEDKWVAAKEPSEFMDEAMIAVYKEGHAPADVLEDLMKGDLPDEIRGQQRAMREQSMKVMLKKEEKEDKLRQQEAMKNVSSDMAELNRNKRDRRTIAEIQRDMTLKSLEQEDEYDNSNKRPRTQM